MKKISVSLSGHNTSISIEPEFADALCAIAVASGKTMAGLILEIDRARAPNVNLSSAIRVYVLKEIQKSE